MSLKPIIKNLIGERSIGDLAAAYAIAKTGSIPKRRDLYWSTVKRIIDNPDEAKFSTIKLFFNTIGIDIEAAIAIAANANAKSNQ